MKKIIVLISLLLAQTSFANEVNFKLEELTKGLHVLYGQGGNIAISTGDDGIYIVDDQFAKLHDQIKQEISKLKPGAPEFVINTHHHGDHTGGNEKFAEAGAHVIAHHNVYKRLLIKHGKNSGFLPVLSFDSQMMLHFNNEDAKLWHYPNAHTDGDAIIFFSNANVVHMGDVYFNLGGLPFVDVDSGGSLQGVIAAVNDVLSRIDEQTKVIPGHGPVTNKAGLQNYLALLEKAKGLMLAAIEKHGDLERVQAARPLQSLNLTYAYWLPEERVTKLFYLSLTKR